MATIEHLPPEIQDLIRTQVYKRNLPKVKSKIRDHEPRSLGSLNTPQQRLLDSI